MLWIIYSSKYDEEADNPAKRMLAEAVNQGIESELLYFNYFRVDGNNLYYKDNIVENFPDVAFLRCNEIWLAEFLESKNVRVINNSYSIKHCKDKLLTHQIVDELGYKGIKTVTLGNKKYKELVKLFGPVFILKIRDGLQGKDIYLIENKKQFKSIVKTIDKNNFLAQEYIITSYGRDVRLYFVGDQFIAACERRNENSFISNIAQGGLTYEVSLKKSDIDKAREIKTALQGEIITIDFVYGENELIFCEANTNAGFQSFAYLGYDMRKIFMNYIKESEKKRAQN